MNRSTATVVFKIGGSLLKPPPLADLSGRLEALVRQSGGERPLLTCGGGAAADLVREWDREYALGETAGHWAAVAALSVTARVLAVVLPGARLVSTPEMLAEAWRHGAPPIYEPMPFLRTIDGARPDPLPRGWSVTSDSIAARMADQFEAGRLILVKSAAPVEPCTLEEAAARGLVDEHFRVAAAGIAEVALVNLRAPDPSLVTLSRRDASSSSAGGG